MEFDSTYEPYNVTNYKTTQTTTTSYDNIDFGSVQTTQAVPTYTSTITQQQIIQLLIMEQLLQQFQLLLQLKNIPLPIIKHQQLKQLLLLLMIMVLMKQHLLILQQRLILQQQLNMKQLILPQ